MRKIKGFVEYNTRTAYKIAQATAQPDVDDHSYWEEILYRDVAGRYFLTGFGGSLTSWARPVGPNGLGGGFGLRALSDEEARAWVADRSTDPDAMYDEF